jgi:beta-galactosidase
LATLDLPRDIRVRDNGATRFVFNYGDTLVDISSIIGDAPLCLGETCLPPCGVAAFTASPA